MNVLFASFECAPFAKVGGLGDVIGTLPRFLRARRRDVRVVLPLHRGIERARHGLSPTAERVTVTVAGALHGGRIWEGRLAGGVPVYFVECAAFFDRDEIYAGPQGDYPDNALRFIFFCRAALEVAKAMEFRPDIVHAHDMQTGLIPAFLRTTHRVDAWFNHTRSVFTVHNIAYQGVFPREVHRIAGLGPAEFTPETAEFYGNINLMKAGIAFADAVTTVSPTYAQLISSSFAEAQGLEGILAAVRTRGRLFGILNGVDYDEWNPTADPRIEAPFDADHPEGKRACTAALRARCGFTDPSVPVLGMVSRLDALKGFDLVVQVLPRLLEDGRVQAVVLGRGAPDIRTALEEFQRRYPDRMKLYSEFDNDLAHAIYAGSDLFLMPSRSEPCGISQMIAMTYGSIPVVFRTGGLADTVEAWNPDTRTGTGFVFDRFDAGDCLRAVESALAALADPVQRAVLMRNAMTTDFSWKRSASQYVRVYERLLSGRSRYTA